MPRATLRKLCDIPHFRGADLETLRRLLQAHGIGSSFHVHVPDARAYTANDAFRTAMLAGSFYRVFVRNVDLSRARTVVADFTERQS
jgi:hypothetical protein